MALSSWVVLLLVVILIIFITAYIIAAAVFLFYTATRTIVEEERVQYEHYRNTCRYPVSLDSGEGEEMDQVLITR